MGLFNLFFGDSEIDSTPSVNVDGAPMCGSIDVNGNPYGVTDISDCSSSIIDDTFNSSAIDDSFSSMDSSMDSSCGFDDW